MDDFRAVGMGGRRPSRFVAERLIVAYIVAFALFFLLGIVLARSCRRPTMWETVPHEHLIERPDAASDYMDDTGASKAL